MLNVSRPSARLVGGALVTVMVLGSAMGAEAATKKKAKHKAVVKTTRTVKLSYTGGCTAEVSVAGNTGGGSLGACTAVGAANWTLQAKPTEKYVSVSVADASGRTVPGQFWEKGSGTGHDTEIPFCGAKKDYNVPAGGSVMLDLDAAGAVQACPGLATQGTVTVVFSNLP